MVTAPDRPDQISTTSPVYAPPPPVKKASKGPWIIAAVVGLFVLGVIASQNDTQGTGTPNRYSSSAPVITEHDAMQAALDANPEAVATFCEGYTNLKSIGLSDAEMLSTLENAGAFSSLEGSGVSSYELFSAMAGRC